MYKILSNGKERTRLNATRFLQLMSEKGGFHGLEILWEHQQNVTDYQTELCLCLFV